MSEEFIQCKCGAPISDFWITNIWRGNHGDVSIVTCRNCGEYEPYKTFSYDSYDSAYEKAIKAWNTRHPPKAQS